MRTAFHHLLMVSVLSVSINMLFLGVKSANSTKSAKKITAKPKLIYKVECPNDRKMRDMITANTTGEDFTVQCSKPMRVRKKLLA